MLAEDYPEGLKVIREAIRTKGVFELDHRVRRTDGSIGWTLSRAVPLLDAARESGNGLGQQRAVTARWQVEDALRTDNYSRAAAWRLDLRVRR